MTRKLWSRHWACSNGWSIINFWTANLEYVATSHKNALVVWAIISNYDVTKVFVNLESSINIFFKETFDRM